MLRTDNLLTRENVIDFMSMLSQSTRDQVRKEVHDAQVAAQEDVKNEQIGSKERAEIQEQINLSTLILQTLDTSTSEFTSLDVDTKTPVDKTVTETVKK